MVAVARQRERESEGEGEKRETIRTRILILSDTHAALPQGYVSDLVSASKSKTTSDPESADEYQTRLQHMDVDVNDDRLPFHHPLPSADVLLHCGDLTMNGSVSQHERAIALLRSVDAGLKIVIPGNHDLTLDRRYYDKHGALHGPWPTYSSETLDRIRDMYVGQEARDAGIRYLEEGVGSFVLVNGARLTVYASAYQPEFWNWAFGYERAVDRFNMASKLQGESAPAPENPVPDFKVHHGEVDVEIEPQNENHSTNENRNQGEESHGKSQDKESNEEHDEHGIDIMLTHGPPHGILDETATNENVGCHHLRRAVQRCRPQVHCFGHIHEGWGAVRMKWQEEDIEGTADQRSDPSTGTGTGTPTDITRQHTRSQPLPLPLPLPSPETQIQEKCSFLDATDLQFGKETLFVNASIMNLQYKPTNAPWMVDLMLPAAL